MVITFTRVEDSDNYHKYRIEDNPEIEVPDRKGKAKARKAVLPDTVYVAKALFEAPPESVRLVIDEAK